MIFEVLDLRLRCLKNTDKTKQYDFVIFSSLHASGPKATEVTYPGMHC